MIDLVYCAAGNARFASIAIQAGYRYGAQLPHTSVYHPLWFADQNWKRPKREAYMAALEKYRPYMATVLDLERPEQLEEVYGWMSEAAPYVQELLVIPKYTGAIDSLPRVVARTPIRLGFSVASSYGSTPVAPSEFGAWPVHLLGGNPSQQLRLASAMNVVSADGNSMQRASMYGTVWSDGRWLRAYRYFGRYASEPDLMYRAFEHSCANVMAAWRNLADDEVMSSF